MIIDKIKQRYYSLIDRSRGRKIDRIKRKYYSLIGRRQQNYESKLADELEFIHLPPKCNQEHRPLRILYIAQKYDYGIRSRGLSFEENNFLNTLANMGHYIIRLNYPKDKKKAIDEIVLDCVIRYSPDLLFTIFLGKVLHKEIIAEISTQTNTVTLNWFCDDTWRFDSFSKYWAPVFNWVVTDAKSALPKYEQIGYKNVILGGWACNHFLYRKLDYPRIHNVTFVGQAHGNRRQVIDELRKSGVSVETWGLGWENGRLSQVEMIKVFNQSKINLNLGEASVSGVKEIKARDFEIPGCGGFMITGSSKDELAEYYDIGKEIIHYESTKDLIDKVKYYLDHDSERESIAEAGYIKTLNEHTYEKRFNDIFRKIGILEN